ncbi:hypothetical protein BaRGS_00032367 [Batillaria attramentaria]|uniref:D-serine dehydratase-like domain-containing protein n=1 Tax=Batillaria attramentaria TaxID=370345 RepID=A0ABD0JN71_9CAEN
MAACPKPCRVGDTLADIETPALVVCLNKLEENIRKMKTVMANYPGVVCRPHVKTHKSPDIARLQMKEGGAVGVCCQTLTEAEAMVFGGVSDILITNQIIGKPKLRRVASLTKQAKVAVCVDSEVNVRDLSEVAVEMGVTVDVVIEVHVGGLRCGVEPGDAVVALAKTIVALPGIIFKGLLCYQGKNQHVRSAQERKKTVDMVAEKVRRSLEALKAAGIECNYVTGGGTGSFQYEASSKVFTEVEPGSYVMMDADYRKNLVEDGNFFTDFQQSLFVVSTVQSVSSTPERAVLDAGMKALSLDSGEPVLSQYPDLTYHNGGDEHGVVVPARDLKIGDKVWLVPGHCDPTVNMHSWIVGMRDGRVECVWPISGRGPGV